MQDSLLEILKHTAFRNHNEPEDSGQELEGTAVRVVPEGRGQADKLWLKYAEPGLSLAN